MSSYLKMQTRCIIQVSCKKTSVIVTVYCMNTTELTRIFGKKMAQSDFYKCLDIDHRIKSTDLSLFLCMVLELQNNCETVCQNLLLLTSSEWCKEAFQKWSQGPKLRQTTRIQGLSFHQIHSCLLLLVYRNSKNEDVTFGGNTIKRSQNQVLNQVGL